MGKQVFTNNATAKITSNLTTVSLSFTIESAFADRFPALVSGDWFVGTLQNIAGDLEIVRVNKRDVGSNAIQNVVRAQEGTTALSFSAGEAVFSVRATAAHHQRISDHLDDTDAAHAASAIAFAPSVHIDSTNSQAATEEVFDKLTTAIALAASLLGSSKVSITDLIAQTHVKVTTSGAAPAFVATPTPALGAYAEGHRYLIKAHVGSAAGANTLNVSALGAKGLKVYSPSSGKVDATFVANQLLDVIYDGTDYVVLNAVGYAEPPRDIRLTAEPTVAPGTRRILMQGQAINLVTYPTLLPLWCGSTLNNHADLAQRADFYYRCTDPLNPNATRSDGGDYLVFPPAGYFLRPMNTGTTGADASRKRFKLQEDDVKAHAHTMPFTWYSGYTPDNYTGHSTPYSAASALQTQSAGGPENLVKNVPVYVWMCY